MKVGAVTEAKKFAAEAQLLLSSNVPPSVEAYVDMSSTFSDESVVRGHVELTEGLLAHVECRVGAFVTSLYSIIHNLSLF